MESLRKLLSESAPGQKLLLALEPIADTELPGLIADVLQGYTGNGAAGANRHLCRVALDDAASVIEGVMFLTPRGKQDLAFFKDRFVVKTAKLDIEVAYSRILHLAILEMPKDTRRRVFLYIDIDQAAGVMNGKQIVTALVIQTTSNGQFSIPHPLIPGDRLCGPAPVVACQAFGMMGLDPSAFCTPDGEAFRSCSGLTGVEACVKASQGTLFPMTAGLCFLERPALFISCNDIKAVEFAREGGGSATFDFYVHLKSGRTQEFSSISRSEVGAFEAFVRRCKLTVGMGESSSEDDSSGEGEPDGGSNSSNDSDSEDEDFNPGSSSSSHSSSSEEDGGEEVAGDTRSAASLGQEKNRGPSSKAGSRNKASRRSEDRGVEGDDPSDGSEDDSSDDSSEDGSSDVDGSVELVSEDEFSRSQLQSVIAAESGPKQKRQRR